MVMFQKSERDLKEIQITKRNNFFVFSLFFISILQAQIDQRFDLFDWEIIGNNGSINSISEGYQYIYFATNGNGILRFSKFSRDFEKGLYFGQGLISKKIKHVYFDKVTGTLWSVGSKALEFSYSREGNWNSIDYAKLSINSFHDIIDIGSSSNFIWIKTSSAYIKLDHINASFLGMFSFPDEEKIFWGDISYKHDSPYEKINFNNYFIENSWLLSINSAFDQNGILAKYISLLETENSYSFIGLTNGQVLLIDKFSRTIKPINYGIEMTAPLTISYEKKVWLAGIGDKKSKSITSISEDFKEIRNFNEINYSNFLNDDFFSSKVIGEEVWFGSKGAILVYNKEEDFFRTIGYEQGIPIGRIYHIEDIGNKVFIGTKEDLVVLDKRTKKIIKSKISSFIKNNNMFIDDLDIDGNNIYLTANHRIYHFDKDENTKANKFNAQLQFFSLFINDKIKHFVTNKGIINSFNESIISSSLYFDYKVNNIILVKNYLFIATNEGLIIYDIKNERLHDFFDFVFLKNIYDMEQIGKYLVLLSNYGLIKLKL